jgi:hypothetical protein
MLANFATRAGNRLIFLVTWGINTPLSQKSHQSEVTKELGPRVTGLNQS